VELELAVIDIDYRTFEEGEEEKVELRVFGKTSQGENVLAVERDFKPYFYVLPSSGVEVEELEDEILEEKFHDDNDNLIEPKAIEKVDRRDGLEEVEALKLFTDVPATVPKLKHEIYSLEKFSGCREFDIPFYKRYLIDNQILPTETVKIEGEEEESEDFDVKIGVESVETGLGLEDIEFSSLAFDLEVIDDEIIMISFYGEQMRKVVSTVEIDESFVETVESEEKLLERIIDVVHENDIDILTGYNTDEFDFQVLRDRVEEHGMKLSLGRDGERMKFNRRGRFAGARLKGRMHLDLYPFIEHVVSPGLDSEKLDLDSVAEEMLGENKNDVSFPEMKEWWDKKENLEEFASYALKDSELAYKLSEELVPQIIELSRITGLTPFDASRLTYGQLTENFLLKEANKKEMIAPNRPTRNERRRRQSQGAYEGGFVYTPESGIHEDIAVFDFRSLYPTVMVAHNISPEVLNLEECEKRFEPEEFDFNFCQDEQGFFPELIEGLVESRYELKGKMKELEKDTLEYESIYSRQQAQKILANSFYGYLGYNGARWYSKESAQATTYMGREYIEGTIDTAQDMGFNMVYGDSLDYSRQIAVRNPEGAVEFLEIGEFVEDVENPEDYETVAWDDNKGKAVFKPVKRAISHEYEGDLLKFDTNRGRTKVTPQHSVYKYEDGIELSDATELEEGDCLVSLSDPPKTEDKYSECDILDLADLVYDSPDLRAYKDLKKFPAERGECPYCQEEYYLSSHVYAQHPERKVTLEDASSEYSYIGCENAKAGKIPRFWDLTSEFAWILGFYCGDGSASDGSKEMISFGGQDKENIKKVKKFFDEKLDEGLALVEDVDSRTGNKMYYYRIQRKPLVRFFVEGLGAGKESSGKKVPNIILNGDEDLKESFIQGYFEADGSKEKEHDSRYNSESIRFSTKSSYLANQVQYILKQLDLGENRYGRKINDVSYKYRDDKPEIKSIRNTAARGPEFSEQDFTPATINHIEEVKPTKNKVYDLEVEGEHNFVDAEGMILVHNTDSVFLSGDEILEKKEEFLEEVNSQLPEFMELEFEGFFKTGFFTSKDSGEGAKKKYALMDEEGGMKITGFEQVRRDWSSVAKETQKKVLRKVLENKVEEAAEEVKDTISRLRDQEVPVEKLKIFTTLTKPPEEYDSTSPHVEAAKKARKRGKEIEPETTIDYVITRGGGGISERAEISEYADSYDADYYIDNQVLPAATRVLKVFGYTEDQLKGKGKQSGLGRFG